VSTHPAIPLFPPYIGSIRNPAHVMKKSSFAKSLGMMPLKLVGLLLKRSCKHASWLAADNDSNAPPYALVAYVSSAAIPECQKFLRLSPYS
jgi:hypothetical protein